MSYKDFPAAVTARDGELRPRSCSDPATWFAPDVSHTHLRALGAIKWFIPEQVQLRRFTQIITM